MHESKRLRHGQWPDYSGVTTTARPAVRVQWARIHKSGGQAAGGRGLEWPATGHALGCRVASGGRVFFANQSPFQDDSSSLDAVVYIVSVALLSFL
ncbi:hypothetical protein MTO96_008677 [Rhipicephalus appendiculatus]